MNVGKVTDEVFLQGLNGKLAKHAHYTSRKVGPLNPTQTMNKMNCLFRLFYVLCLYFAAFADLYKVVLHFI